MVVAAAEVLFRCQINIWRDIHVNVSGEGHAKKEFMRYPVGDASRVVVTTPADLRKVTFFWRTPNSRLRQ